LEELEEAEEFEDAEDAEEVAEVEELEEVDGTEESQPDGFGSHTVPPTSGAPPAARRSWRPSRVMPAVLGAALVGGLALVTVREFGRASTAAARVETKPASPAAKVGAALAPVESDVPLSARPAETSSASPENEGDASASPPTRDAANATVIAMSPDAVSVAASNRVLAPPAAAVAVRRAPVAPATTAAFDVAATESAIEAAFERARSCKTANDPKGVATVTLTYAPSGRITTALVSGVFAGTSTGSCIAGVLRSARIPPFSGSLVTVKRSATF
jgi:hypothetical protein